jgi:hypothetical protein
MGLREELLKRVEKKQQEIKELELRTRESTAYLQGLLDTLKMLPRESATMGEPMLRPGTAIAKARDFIKKNGSPMHVNAILKAMGKTIDRNSRAALSGSLSAYVKRGEVFTRPAPNTFGLLEMESTANTLSDEPPETFGQDEQNAPPIGGTPRQPIAADAKVRRLVST